MDPASGALYLTHGFTDAGRFDDTWSLGNSGFTDASGRGPRPIRRCLMSAAFHERGLYIFGGQTDSRPFLGDLWRLDVGARAWRRLSPRRTPSPRNLYASAQTRSAWLIHGGASPRGERGDMWRFDLRRETFSRVRTSARGPGARSSHAAVAAGSRLVLFGGSDGSRELRDTWVMPLR